MPEPFAQVLADSDLGIACGDLLVAGNAPGTSLAGRPATPMHDAVKAAVGALCGPWNVRVLLDEEE